MGPLAERLVLSVVPPLASAYLRFLRRTMRLAYRNREVLERARGESGQYILAFWHSRFLMMPYSYPGSRMTVMMSRHRDAELLARMLRRFGYEFSRGSTTRGGAAALRDLLRRLREGSDAGVAPDGPRGPRRRAQPGAIAVARLSGLPIVPLAFSAAPARRLATWDRTMLPRPFSRGLFLYGEPLRVPRSAGPEEQELLRGRLEEELDRLTDQADLETGVGAEEPRPPQEPP
jgi:lysophospholipid acyltransferase (LPLAT)-like uncharacterized protein